MLKLTLASGDVQEVPFSTASTLTVANQVQVQPGESYTDSKSWSEIVGIEIVEDPAPAAEPAPVVPETTAGAVDAQAAAPALPADDPTLASPQAALDTAATLPLDDAKIHVDAALVKFPDDPDLLAAKADLDAESAPQ